MIYFHSYRSPGLVIDIVQDIRKLNDLSLKAKKAGMIILGGGVCKHQIANAMLFVSQLLFMTGKQTDHLHSGMALTMLYILTLVKSLMAPIRAQDRMKLYLGVKSKQVHKP
jgi:hypothetical protein